MGIDWYCVEDVMFEPSLEGEYGVEYDALNLEADGDGRRGQCPFCKHDSHSFTVSWRDDWYCTECKEGGNVFEFSRRLRGFTFIEAKQYFGAWPYHRPPEPDPSLSVLENEIRAARKLWEDSGGVRFTAAHKYLQQRGIPLNVYRELENLRACEIPFQGDGEEHPAIIAAIRDAEGGIQGLQRTYLTQSGQKLCSDNSRQCLGKIDGGAIILGNDPTDITLCVGLEEGLTHRLMEPDRSVWVCANMKALTTLSLPVECRQLHIAQTPQMGELRAAHAMDTYSIRGRYIGINKSKYGGDFNDTLTRPSEAEFFAEVDEEKRLLHRIWVENHLREREATGQSD